MVKPLKRAKNGRKVNSKTIFFKYFSIRFTKYYCEQSATDDNDKTIVVSNKLIY